MPARKLNKKSIRKLTRLGGHSLGLTLPIEITRDLGWRERQKTRGGGLEKINMNIFQKGNFQKPSTEFKQLGLAALLQLSEFQNKFDISDTDTTINSIRDTIIAGYLGFDLVNHDKHGFDAKKSKTGEFLEVKQCSASAKRWGGTWNDTNLEKAKAFSDKRLFTVVAVWKGASDLQFIVYGQDERLGKYLLERVKSRKAGSRSTQNIGIEKLIEWGFVVIVPPDKDKNTVLHQLFTYNKRLSNFIHQDSLKTIKDF